MFCTNKHKGNDWQGEANYITDYPAITMEEVNCANGVVSFVETIYEWPC